VGLLLLLGLFTRGFTIDALFFAMSKRECFTGTSWISPGRRPLRENGPYETRISFLTYPMNIKPMNK
jgi:hypothetical protein